MYKYAEQKLIKNDGIKYIIAKNIIVRYDPMSNKRYTLFDITTGKTHFLNSISYLVLKMFYNSPSNLSNVMEFLESRGIKLDRYELQFFLESMIKRKIIVNSNISISGYADRYFMSSRQYKAPVASAPYDVEIHFTNACNLLCRHCAYSAGEKLQNEVPFEKWKLVFDQLENLNVQQLILSGGEPLIYPDIKVLIRHLITKRIRVNLFTNGTLIDNELGILLSNYNFSTSISLDGIEAYTHNRLRGCICFEDTINGIKNMSKNNAKFHISTTIHKKNMHKLTSIISYVEKLGASSISFMLLEPIGRALNNSDLLLTELDRKEINHNISQLEKDKKFKIIINAQDSTKNNYDDLLYINRGYSTKGDNTIYCPGGTTRMAIRSDGKVFPCSFAFNSDEFCMGNILKTDIIKIWKADEWSLFRGDIDINHLTACKDCELQQVCYIKNCRLKPYFTSGNFYGASVLCDKLN